jgi:formylmethanofuran dehydrogenase subunit A
METMHLAPELDTTPTELTDEALFEMFATAGLAVTVVAHCDDAGCPACFADSGTQAARAA